MGTLEATWCILDREKGMDDLAVGNQDILKKMIDNLKIYPFQDTDKNNRIFLARFESIKYGGTFTFSDAGKSGSYSFIDFLTGVPVDCVEMFIGIGEYSTKAKDVSVDAATAIYPKLPTKGLFKWPDANKIFLNYTAIAKKDYAKILAKNLEGEPKPTSPKFWFRVQIKENDSGENIKFPIPGEFFGLGIRIFPGKYWGHQKSSPFIYAGNWMDTVFYTSGRIVAVNEPTEDQNFYTYTVKWHKLEIENVCSSDFNVYEVDDRVTIIKDIAATKASQLWKDADMKTFGSKWSIVPVMYYEISNKPS